MTCMTLQSKLREFGKTLSGLPVSVFHYTRGRTALSQYAVWQEEGEGDAFYAGNQKVECHIAGTLDYFTKVEYDTVADEIQKLLKAECATWRLNSVQYEEETGLIHFEWEWELSYGKL